METIAMNKAKSYPKNSNPRSKTTTNIPLLNLKRKPTPDPRKSNTKT